MCDNQKSLLHSSLNEMEKVQFLAHTLKSKKFKKYYKKCSSYNCTVMIINKPWVHLCFEHKIKYAPVEDVVVPFKTPLFPVQK